VSFKEETADILPDIYVNDNYGDPNSIYTLALGNDTIKCYDCVDMNYYNRKFASVNKRVPRLAFDENSLLSGRDS
jgi:hypothetical protein